MKSYLIALLVISMMAFAMTLQAQESSQPISTKEALRAEDTRKFPDSTFDEKLKRPDSLPDDQRRFPDSTFDEKRQRLDSLPDDQRRFPDSTFDGKQRSH